MLNLQVSSRTEVGGKLVISIYASSNEAVALGGFSLGFNSQVIYSNTNTLITPTSIESSGGWDLFDGNSALGKVSGISAFGIQFNSSTGLVPLFKINYQAIPSNAIAFLFNFKSIGSDSFFDANGNTLIYQDKYFYQNIGSIGNSLTQVEAPFISIAPEDKSVTENQSFSFNFSKQTFFS